MANLRLKKTILEVVDNQLKANDPPCTKDVYEKLRAAGYSRAEAKDKIGAVVLSEIYDIMKEGQPFDEGNYKNCLEEMLVQSLDYEDDHHIETEWDQWEDLISQGYECFSDQKEAEGLHYWQGAWKAFCSIVEQNPKKNTFDELMDEIDYEYSIDGWLQDYEMELGNAGNYEERIAFCPKVLEMFDWEEDDDSCFQCGIGESLFREGKVSQAFEHYEKWLAEDPHNANGIISFSGILLDNGDTDRAYAVIRDEIWGLSCNMDNSFLFMHAKELADEIGKEDESAWYQQQLDRFNQSIRKRSKGRPMPFERLTVPQYQQPVVKEKKIYPNDPCPCGSGKKYKKCCGRK